MNDISTERLRDFPLFHWWLQRARMDRNTWEFGFYFAPWPRSEHSTGDMVRALVMLECFFSPRLGFRHFLWLSDPADRPTPPRNPAPIQAAMNTKTKRPAR